MKTLLKIKFELLVTPLFITLFIMSVMYVGFFKVSDYIFNFIILISIPCSYLGIRLCRKLIYEVWYGKNK